jgi:NitT/TauT family transport system permease protein
MRARLARAGVAAVAFVLLVAAWKAYIAWSDVSAFLLPAPEAVGAATLDLLGDGRTWHHVWVTVHEIGLGFAIATVLGVAVGALLGEVPFLDRALTPYVVVLQVVPKVAIVPILLMWMGFGPASKVALAAIFGFFPIFAGTRAGVRSVDGGHRDLATTLQARLRHRLFLFELPSAMPSILTGMEIGMVLATVGAVVGEYLSGGEGLGYLVVSYTGQLQIEEAFGVIVLLSVLGYVLHAAVAGLRRLLVPWHASATPLDPAAL